MRPSRDALHAGVRRALACPDETWYRHMLRQDASGCPLGEAEIAGVLRGALAAAAEVAREIGQAHPAASPGALASALGLDVVPLDEHDGMGPLPLLGLYQPAGRRIMLNETGLNAIEELIAAHGLEALTPARDLRACVLYHEIFHALEDARPGIFTRSAMLRRTLFGLIPRRRGLASASEIGAVHFSRLMAGIAYSPCIFGHYLLLAEGRIDADAFPG